MLEGLDEIPWGSLRHAYGSASDVPDLLRALLADNAEQRQSAQGELFGNIWHQGTVYEATAHAVPFLLELLRNPNLRDRDVVLLLFASIAAGRGYLEVHAQDLRGASSWRRILSERGTTLKAEMAREADTIAAVRARVMEGVDLLLANLQGVDVELRSTVAAALQFYPSRADQIIPALNSALVSESEAEVREILQSTLDVLRRGRPA